MKPKIIPFVVLCLLYLFSGFGPLLGPQPTRAAEAVVHAVLFFSPDCSHCHEVVEKVLTPLVESYKEQLDIVGIDTSQEVGLYLYQSMLDRYNVPDERVGVPTLVVDDQVLVGSQEIPELLPDIVEQGLHNGGVDWPNIPGLKEILDAQTETLPEPGQAPQPQPANEQSSQSVLLQRFKRDLLANSIAVIVLLGMIAAVVNVGFYFVKETESPLYNWPDWTIPVLALIGMAIALYLSYVEVLQAEAVCGPVGDCNTVQQSPYARLFGVLPIGVMGVMGYIAILLTWALRKHGPKSMHGFFSLAIWGGAMFGVLFSIYLTFLEPFVIGATCAWCASSAIIMTLLLLATTNPARQAIGSSADYVFAGDDYDDYDEDDDDDEEGEEQEEQEEEVTDVAGVQS